MKKAPEKPKTAKTSTSADPKMDGPFSEKDEVKKAEENTRKGISKEKK